MQNSPLLEKHKRKCKEWIRTAATRGRYSYVRFFTSGENYIQWFNSLFRPKYDYHYLIFFIFKWYINIEMNTGETKEVCSGPVISRHYQKAFAGETSWNKLCSLLLDYIKVTLFYFHISNIFKKSILITLYSQS